MSEQDLVALVMKMQQQLTFLEKKIDTLIEQSSRRPSFSRPQRSFDRPQRSFDRPHHGFDYKKKTYGDSREGGNSGHDRPYARREEAPREGFYQKRKPSFPYKRRDRG